MNNLSAFPLRFTLEKHKHFFTDLINLLVRDEKEKLHVFRPYFAPSYLYNTYLYSIRIRHHFSYKPMFYLCSGFLRGFVIHLQQFIMCIANLIML